MLLCLFLCPLPEWNWEGILEIVKQRFCFKLYISINLLQPHHQTSWDFHDAQLHIVEGRWEGTSTGFMLQVTGESWHMTWTQVNPSEPNKHNMHNMRNMHNMHYIHNMHNMHNMHCMYNMHNIYYMHYIYFMNNMHNMHNMQKKFQYWPQCQFLNYSCIGPKYHCIFSQFHWISPKIPVNFPKIPLNLPQIPLYIKYHRIFTQ